MEKNYQGQKKGFLKEKIKSNYMKIDKKRLMKARLVARAVSNEARIRIMEYINKHDKTKVTPIYVHLRMEQAVVSSHLKILRDADLVFCTKEGKSVIYELNEHLVNNITEVMGG